MPIEGLGKGNESKEVKAEKSDKKVISVESKKALETKLTSIKEKEQNDTLEENIGTPEGRDLIMEKIHSGDITPDIFGKWYAKKSGSVPSKELLSVLKTSFDSIQGKNGDTQAENASGTMFTILESAVPSIEVKKTVK